MNGGYITIASILLYFLLLQTLDSPKMNARKAATIFTLGSFALLLVVTMLENAARGMPVLTDTFTASRIIGSLLQFGGAFWIFYKVEQINDDYVSFILWGGAGLAIIFYAIPEAAQRITALL